MYQTNTAVIQAKKKNDGGLEKGVKGGSVEKWLASG